MPHISVEIKKADFASDHDKRYTVRSARHLLMRLRSSHVVQARLEDTSIRTGL